MYTIITLTQIGYSTHTLFSRPDAEIMFEGATTMSKPDFVEAVFLYGPEGQINNWLKERE